MSLTQGAHRDEWNRVERRETNLYENLIYYRSDIGWASQTMEGQLANHKVNSKIRSLDTNTEKILDGVKICVKNIS